MCHGQGCRVFLGMGNLPPLVRILIMGYNGYINPYHWVDDHPLLYGNNGSLDPGTYGTLMDFWDYEVGEFLEDRMIHFC